MKNHSFIKFLILGVICGLTTVVFASQDKVLQIFKNGEVIQEYSLADIDYIEVNDELGVPEDLAASVKENSITITWSEVYGATYNVYRSADNVNFTLIASELEKTSYTDKAPNTGANYYRVTAVVGGRESKHADPIATVFTGTKLPSGIYLGINGFSRGMQTKPIHHLSEENVSDYHSFINGLTATQSFTWLYYTVEKTIDNLKTSVFPDDLSEVAIVTFTDGLDVGSLDEKDKEEPEKYINNTQYRDALHSRLTSEKVSGVDISAYTIGVLEGRSGASLTTFRSNMSSLSSSSTNVFEVEKMESLNQAFEQIANSLSETEYVQKFSLSISGQGEGELCRFTFDNVSSYGASKLYIEGTYRRRDKALTNVKYVGLTSTSGTEVIGVYDEESGKYDYVFEGLKANDGSLIPTTQVQHWFTDEGRWQDVDDEFFFDPDDATVEKSKSSLAIMLHLDCSKSMDGSKLTALKEAANKFVDKLMDNSIDPYEVSSVSLDKNSLTLQIGQSTTLVATVLPTTAKLKTVTWTSSNTSVATVDKDGKVTATGLGNAIITATTNDGGYKAICQVSVSPDISLDIYQPTKEEVENSIYSCRDYIDQMITAMYYLTGGKDGAMPQEHQWQYIYAMNTDNYCGYHCMINSKFMQGMINNTYAYVLPYSEGPYERFLSMKKYLSNFLNIEQSNNIVEIKALALLLFNIVAQENTDIYGAIPYIDHRGNKEENPFAFNSGLDTYYNIIDNLDKIIAVFENYNNRPQWYKDLLAEQLQWVDVLSTGKTFDDWKRCAASIKLRMAMHLVKVAPEDAKRFAEEAVASGVVTDMSHQIGVGTFSGLTTMHPLKVIFNDWNDSRMNASFISILKSLNHPYLEYLIAPNSNTIINEKTGAVMDPYTDIVGVRAGLMMEPSQQYFSNMRCAYSQPDMNCNDFLYAPEYVVKLAEVEFLRAEGALRGWNMGGDAEYFYNEGIKHADMSDPGFMSENYSSRVDDYMAQTDATPYTYVDPMDDANNIESVTKIGVKWNDSDDPETKLEKIITQKYIAIYPNSYEAWTEMRRTGYPKIFPVLNPTIDNDGSLAFGDLIRRMRLPNGGTAAGIEDVNRSGIPAIGGPDIISTRVFWDIEVPNL